MFYWIKKQKGVPENALFMSNLEMHADRTVWYVYLTAGKENDNELFFIKKEMDKHFYFINAIACFKIGFLFSLFHTTNNLALDVY